MRLLFVGLMRLGVGFASLRVVSAAAFGYPGERLGEMRELNVRGNEPAARRYELWSAYPPKSAFFPLNGRSFHGRMMYSAAFHAALRHSEAITNKTRCL